VSTRSQHAVQHHLTALLHATTYQLHALLLLTQILEDDSIVV
jgi:hypothetical protein